MTVLSEFHIPTREEEENFFFDTRRPGFNTKKFNTSYTSHYPFGLFQFREMPENFTFSDITIFCGNNGSGKSTLLNVISEKLELDRGTPYNRSDFFEDYTGLCTYELCGRVSADSRIITSDDVFNRVLEIRRLNAGIDDRRSELMQEYVDNRRPDADGQLHGLADYDRWKQVHDARKKTASSYIRSNLVRNVEERSNGESALAFFVDAIADGGLYLLDEPENSLSPSNQLQFKYFLEDCVRHHDCQFVISTHSPFLLSLRGARIYDIDSAPVRVCPWTELDCVRVYHDFFAERALEFDK